MKTILSFRWVVLLTLFLFGGMMLFHLSVVTGMLLFHLSPVDFLWGGRMETNTQLLVFEIISFVISGLCLLVVLIWSGRIHLPRLMGTARIGLWILFVLFILNTIGNILAKTTFEKSAAVVTALLAILVLRLALEKPGDISIRKP